MTKKVYKISSSNAKSVYLDLGIDADVPDNFYHSIEFDKDYSNLYVAGLNTGGRGNLLKYPIDDDNKPGRPIIMNSHFSKHLVIRNDVIYVTIDDGSLLIINKEGPGTNR